MLPLESGLQQKSQSWTFILSNQCSPNQDKSFWIFWLKAVPSALRYYSVNGSFIVAERQQGKLGFWWISHRTGIQKALLLSDQSEPSVHVTWSDSDQWEARNTKLSAQCLGCCRVCCKYWPALNISCGYRTWLHTWSEPEQSTFSHESKDYSILIL